MRKLMLVTDDSVVFVNLPRDNFREENAELVKEFLLNHLPVEHNELFPFSDSDYTVNGWIAETNVIKEFNLIRAEFGVQLTQKEIECVTNALGYACRQVIRCHESVSPATVVQLEINTILEWYYDTSETPSSGPDFEEFFRLAKLYMVEGSPVRQKSVREYDSAGHLSGMSKPGTRKVEGVGEVAENVRFWTKVE